MGIFDKLITPKDGDIKFLASGNKYVELRYDSYWNDWVKTGKQYGDGDCRTDKNGIVYRLIYDSYYGTFDWVKQHTIISEDSKKTIIKKEGELPKVVYKIDNTEATLANKKEQSGNPNLQIIAEKDNQLMLDYDYEEIPLIFNRMLPILEQRVNGTLTWEKYRSSSGKHWHVIIDMPINMSAIERVAWQSVFGSDNVRESLALLRIHKNIKDPVVLFMDPSNKPEETGSTEVIGRKFRDE